MGYHEDTQDCPACGCKQGLDFWVETRPHDSAGGECLDCGFHFYTVENRYSLEVVNERRAEHDLAPLDELPEVREAYRHLPINIGGP